MADPFLGEVRMFGGSFAPLGWEFCNGQLLPISENDALYNLIGTTYGGDGQTTFGLPDLRGRVPIHQGTGAGLPTYVLGQMAGAETVTLTTQQMPAHTHAMQVSSGAGNTTTPSGVLANASSDTVNAYKAPAAGDAQVALNAASVGFAGGNQPHNNIQPTIAVSYIIAVQGIYPSQA